MQKTGSTKQNHNIAATIMPRDLTVTATGIDKVYDATTVATVALSNNALIDDRVIATSVAAAF